ncbi:hypothetical protein A3715_09585 [Oleiphilus sp. HI0009]|nr:hypothetical protein A3715_09585 [Oleiphilus sp. HI0009]
MTHVSTMQNLNPKKQKGAALFISLIFLLILTVLGVSSMNDTIMQGKMSAAIQDGNVALQGSETAVRAAEQAIEAFISTTGFNSTGPFYTNGNAPDPFDASIWVDDVNNTATQAAGAVAGQTVQPRYFIELAGSVEDDGLNTGQGDFGETGGGYGSGTGNPLIITFRIVARSTGGTANSQRIIETYYGKKL